MKKIMIIGCSGSGKTTLGRELSEKLNLPLIHLDKINWKDNWTTIAKREFDELLMQELIKPEWIIDGNYKRTIPTRIKYCDTIVYLDYARITCLYGVIKRVILSYGKTRSDMGANCPERFDLDFMKFIWNFNKNNRRKYYETLSHCNDDTEVIILKNRRDVKRFLLNI